MDRVRLIAIVLLSLSLAPALRADDISVEETRFACCNLRRALAGIYAGLQLDLNAGPLRLDRNAWTLMAARGYRTPRLVHPGGGPESDSLFHSPDGETVRCTLHPEGTEECIGLEGAARDAARLATATVPLGVAGPGEGRSTELVVDIEMDAAVASRFSGAFQVRVMTTTPASPGAGAPLYGAAPKSPRVPKPVPAGAPGRVRVRLLVPLGQPTSPSEIFSVAVGPAGNSALFVWPDATIQAWLTDERGAEWVAASAVVSADNTAPTVSLWELLAPDVRPREPASPAPSAQPSAASPPPMDRPLTPPRGGQ